MLAAHPCKPASVTYREQMKLTAVRWALCRVWYCKACNRTLRRYVTQKSEEPVMERTKYLSLSLLLCAFLGKRKWTSERELI